MHKGIWKYSCSITTACNSTTNLTCNPAQPQTRKTCLSMKDKEGEQSVHMQLRPQEQRAIPQDLKLPAHDGATTRHQSVLKGYKRTEHACCALTAILAAP
eukprot:3838264-Amphidinium_carterae.1